jgi:hypothetical protein
MRPAHERLAVRVNDQTAIQSDESQRTLGPLALLQRASAALDAAIAQVGVDPQGAIDDLVAARLLLSAALTTFPDGDGPALDGVSA